MVPASGLYSLASYNFLYLKSSVSKIQIFIKYVFTSSCLPPICCLICVNAGSALSSNFFNVPDPSQGMPGNACLSNAFSTVVMGAFRLCVFWKSENIVGYIPAASFLCSVMNLTHSFIQQVFIEHLTDVSHCIRY